MRLPKPSPKPPPSLVDRTTVSISIPTDLLDTIKEAASTAGLPYTIFIRVAAKREAERLLRRVA